jgi:hypothetical protein
MRLLCVVLVLAGFLMSPRHAFADGPDAARADELFQRAREAMTQGQPARAIPLLEESQTLDPGTGTLLNLAQCHADLGHTATAYRIFGEALFSAERRNDAEQTEAARERREALLPRLSMLRVTVTGEMSVAVDGALLSPSLYDRDVPVDPGRHSVTARSPQGEAWERTVTIEGEATRTSVDIPAFERAVVGPPPPTVTSRWPPARVAGAATLSVSAIAFGLGIYSTARALDLRSESDDACPSGRCSIESVALNDAARAHGDRATGFAIAGVACAIAGTILLLTGHPQPRSQARALAW